MKKQNKKATPQEPESNPLFTKEATEAYIELLDKHGKTDEGRARLLVVLQDMERETFLDKSRAEERGKFIPTIEQLKAMVRESDYHSEIIPALVAAYDASDDPHYYHEVLELIEQTVAGSLYFKAIVINYIKALQQGRSPELAGALFFNLPSDDFSDVEWFAAEASPKDVEWLKRVVALAEKNLAGKGGAK